MLAYIVRRVLYMVPTFFLISVASFVVIQAPPGDMLTAQLAQLEAQGEMGSGSALEQVQALRERYRLDDPMPVRYAHWMGNILLRGDFGDSFSYEASVAEVIWDRLGLTFLMTVTSLIFTWAVAIPIGVYSATHLYSKGDYFFTFLGFLGLATPNFFLALVAMFFQANVLEAASIGGLFAPEYIGAPWSWAKFKDLLAHIWVPVIVIGTAGTAAVMRIMRGNLLDVLGQPHIQTGRAKGLAERVVVARYGVRIAINPLISRLGLELPNLLSGAVVASIVLGLPTAGPVFLSALLSQDMYLAGAFLLLASLFLLLGNLLADIALAWLDPRIRYD